MLAELLRPRITAPQGLAGYWPLGTADLNIVGSKAIDRSGFGRDGTLNGSLASSDIVPGKVRQALLFDGVAKYISMGSTVFAPDAGFSASIWYMPTDATLDSGGLLGLKGASAGFISAVGKSGNTGIAAHALYFGFRGSAAIYSDLTAAFIGASVNNWQHLAITYNGGTKGTASSWNAVFNGAPLALTATTNVGGAANANVIGVDSGLAVAFFKGRVNDARVYSRALGNQEIANIYRAGQSGRA